MTVTEPAVRTVPDGPAAAPGWTGLVARATAAAAADPAAAWRDLVATVGQLLRPPDLPDRPVVTGLHPGPVKAGDAERWPLDADPAAGDLVVLARRDDDGPVLSWYAAADLDLRDTRPAPGTRVWGGTEAVVPGGARPLLDPDRSRPGPDPDAAWALLAGAHAVGVAHRFREAFVAKARVTNRGWYALRMIEDPTVLKALVRADADLAAAAALLRERAGATDRAGAGVPAPAAERAATVAAGVHALDAARAAATDLLTLTGASALYDGNRMQETVLHLGVLGQHGMFSRSTRLRTARELTGTDRPTPAEEPR